MNSLPDSAVSAEYERLKLWYFGPARDTTREAVFLRRQGRVRKRVGAGREP